MRVLGLMSGTSADGVDAVLAEFTGPAQKPTWSLLNVATTPYSSNLRKTIIDAGQGRKLSSSEWLELAEAITEVHASAAKACEPQGRYQLVGCHGQTIWHRPPRNECRGSSWQIIHASLLAQILNRAVVYDFRTADLLLGGHGAPLVPKADEALLGRSAGWLGVLNLGGIANLTLIPPRSGIDQGLSVVGWDCGPANSLVDLAVQETTNAELTFDRDGLIAARGEADSVVIQKWLKESFFQLQPPKSTGREQFGCMDLQLRWKGIPSISKEDLIATLTAFSAAVVAQDLDNLMGRGLVRPAELLVAGGGRRNPVMLAELRRRCRGTRIINIDEIGIPSQSREALAFALLAWWHSLNHPGNSPVITGAKRSVVLGSRIDPL